MRETRSVAKCSKWTGKLISVSGGNRTKIPWRTGAVLVQNHRGIAVVTIESFWTNLKSNKKSARMKKSQLLSYVEFLITNYCTV